MDIKNALSSLTVNEDVFNAVRSEIEHNNIGDSIPQPIIVIGNEGFGKTTLLRRLYKVCMGKHIVWIDGRSLFSTADIIERHNLTNDSLLFIDDMDFYFTRCSYEEQFRLRRFLYNEGAPMLIATASRVLPALAEYDAPFFEGLKIIYLNPVSKDDISLLFDGKALERAVSMFDLMSPAVKSVGIIYNIIKLNNNSQTDKDILLSIFSDRYKNLYQRLPANSQNILNTLASNDNGMSIAEIRENSGLPTNVLTAYLKRLRDLGIITADKSIKRNTIYVLKDRLFRIWLAQSSPI